MDWNVVELRQYTLKPSRRDDLIELFDEHFIESQEEVGMRIFGQFRDLDAPDHFVWVRGFADMASRPDALTAFYQGHDAWRAHAAAANDTMIDVDNVLLLRPTSPCFGFEPIVSRPPIGTSEGPASLISATICPFDRPVDEEFISFFDDRVRPELTAAGAQLLATFETEPSENNFPSLPVREDENVFVWFTRFADEADHSDHLHRLRDAPAWNENVFPELSARTSGALETLRLSPTARSELR